MSGPYCSASMRLPLFVRMLEDPWDNLGLPVDFPFSLYTDSSVGLVRQRVSPELPGLLDRAYLGGSVITGQMAPSGIGKSYAGDFLDYVIGQAPGRDLRGLRVLEIGCGTGYLLHCIQERGADVLGVEPGFRAFKHQETRVPILTTFFPTPEVSGYFDLILLYGVVEHVLEPQVLLSQCSEYLTDQGKVVLSVPNCAEALREGDLSILIHEHLSYFTDQSLRRLLPASGMQVQSIQRSGFGGAIYGAAIRSEGVAPGLDEGPLPEQDLDGYLDKGNAQCARLHEVIAQSDRVAIYVPSRLMNHMHLIRDQVSFERLVLIDDDPGTHHRYLPGIPSECLPFDAVANSEVDTVVIGSRSFGRAIADRVRERMEARIVLLADLTR